MPSTSSLDALLDKIHSESALELSQEPLSAPVSVSARSAHVEDRAIEQAGVNTVQERNEMWESNLSPRQKSLPKIPANMLGGILAIMVLMVGVGSATLLTQENQDVRQQAFEDTTPELAGTSATLTQAEYESQMDVSGVEKRSLGDQNQAWGTFLERTWTSTEIVVVAVAGVLVVGLCTLVVWVLFF